MGNLGLQLGQGKEQWMEPLHPIIRLSVASVKDFLDKLIDIDHDIGKAFQHNITLNLRDIFEKILEKADYLSLSK